MSSVREQPPVRPTSPKGRILRSQIQPQMESSPPATFDSGGDDKSTESTALIKRKRAPAQTPKAVRDNVEMIDFIMGREHEVLTADATSRAAEDVADKGGELEFPDVPLSDDDQNLQKYLTALDKLEVTDDEATEEVVRDMTSPLKKKQRKLTKGASVATVSEAEAAGNDTTAAKAMEPVAAAKDKVKAEKEVRKSRSKGKGAEDRTREGLLPPSLQLPPS
ncbi:hypothetical protein Dimus_003090, partial [Dionaea muscipula]